MHVRKKSTHAIELNEEAMHAFNTILKSICEPPILALPKPAKELSIDTDACAGQIGAALFQLESDGKRHPIGYWSRTLTFSGKELFNA